VPRAGLDRATVVARAAQLLDEGGQEALGLGAVAASLGVKTPSLYKHVDGLPGLVRGVLLGAKASLGREMGRAAVGRSREDAVRAMAVAYRRWALEHPGQYPLTVRAPAPGDEEDREASQALADVVYAVLDGYGLAGDDLVDATRAFRAALHGFVSLETGAAFGLPVDVDRSFDRLVESVVTALAGWSRD